MAFEKGVEVFPIRHFPIGGYYRRLQVFRRLEYKANDLMVRTGWGGERFPLSKKGNGVMVRKGQVNDAVPVIGGGGDSCIYSGSV